jgi:leader peptidase (prepilin peptidase)/N-methyltransferase
MPVDRLVQFLENTPISAFAVAIGIVALAATAWSTKRGLQACGVLPGWIPWGWGVVAGGLAAGLTVAELQWLCQETPDVRPTVLWWFLRPAFHAMLIVLLVAATATDLKTYYILDAVTLTGAVLAVVLATGAGDLQICHVWVDWNAEVPQLQGPYIPAWLGAHPHWHGLAWSLAGLTAGAGLTWAARAISSVVLGQEALGFGDVTLMGMIGAFIGWQPVLIVFLIAPLCALLTGLIVRLVSSKTYVPYGPYLALAAVIVLFNWQRIWMFEWQLAAGGGRGRDGLTFAVRRLFGDATGLLILTGMVAGGLVVLLGAWRLYLSLPVSASRIQTGPPPSSEPASSSDVNAP